MARVFIPAPLQSLTEQRSEVRACVSTVAEVIDDLDRQFPGIGEQLRPAGRLRPGLSVVVDGSASSLALRHPLEADTELHFLPALGGG
jgi:molybdopterin synthase sulfur carrier subunit